MDNARSCTVPVRIEPGAGTTARVFALFNDKIFSIAESTKLTLTLVLEYSQYDKSYRDEYAPTVDVLFRNAMTWEDDRRMAAFISGRDPAAFGFTRGVLAATKSSFNKALSEDLQSAILIYEALRTYGLNYLKDPASPLAKSSKIAVDSLQFPQQTFQYKSGDCDDLTILYTSLLESLGIETAFITTPGHVFAAFDPGVRPEDAVRFLGKTNDFIIKDDKAWIPVEMTALSSDFMSAWREGSREWLAAKDSAAIYSTHEAWLTYAPVVISSTARAPAIPQASRLSSSLNAELAALFARELNTRESVFVEGSKKQGMAEKSLNSLGLLYARFGLYDKAKAASAPGIYTGPATNPFYGIALALTESGGVVTVHAVWSQTANASDLYYSRATSADFNSWTSAFNLGNNKYGKKFQLASNASGNLYLLHLQSSTGIVLTTSTNGGVSWSNQTLDGDPSFTSSAHYPAAMALAVSGSTICVAYSTDGTPANQHPNGYSITFKKSIDGGDHW